MTIGRRKNDEVNIEYYPEKVLHPNITLNEKLNELEMSQKEFALRSGKPEQTIVAVLKGESSITVEIAKNNWVEPTRNIKEKTT